MVLRYSKCETTVSVRLKQRRRGEVGKRILLFVLTVFIFSETAHSEEQEIYQINLPAQSVAESLIELSEQIDVLLLFPSEIAKELKAKPVRGNYTLPQALEIMLQDTGYSGGLSKKGVLMISLEKSVASNKDGKTKGDKMNTKTAKRSLIAGIAAFLTSVVAVPDATAQNTQGSGTSMLEEIIVTAQKREQSVQDVTAQITVTQGKLIQDYNIIDAKSLQDFVPGLSIKSIAAGTANATIRGVGTNAGSASFDQSVSLFMDGVYSGRTFGFDGAFFDIDRIEVIKGPQSTLLGKNTSLGAINIMTKNPTQTQEGYVRGGYEFENEGWLTEAAVGGPVTDRVQYRVAGRMANKGGWVRNVATGHDGPDTDSWGIRGKLFIQAADNLDLALMYQHDELDREGNSGQFVTAHSPLVPEGIPDDRKEDTTISPTAEEFGDYETDRFSFKGDWSIGEHVLTFETTYVDAQFAGDLDIDVLTFTPGLVDVVLQEEDFQQFTQEVRLTSPAEERFSYILGVYYYDSSWDFSNSDEDGTNLAAPPIPSLFPNVPSTFNQDHTSIAGFAAMDYDVTDKIKFHGGFRFTDEEKEALQDFPGIGPVTLKRDSTALDGNVSLQYYFSDDVMVYASYGKGSKSGGFSEAAAPGVNAVEDEKSKSYELGLKSTLLQNQLRFNANFFYTDVDDFQFTQFVGTGFSTSNLDVKTVGFEIETQWYATDHLRFHANVVYADTEDKATGDPLERAPEWDALLGGTFNHDLDTVSLSLDVNASYTSKLLHDPPSTGNRRVLEATTKDDIKLNIKATVTSLDNKWEVSIVGRNLDNDYPIRQAAPITCSLQCLTPGGTEAWAPVEEGRTVMLQAGYNF